MYYVKNATTGSPVPSTIMIPEDTYYPPCDLEESDPSTILPSSLCAAFPAQALTYYTSTPGDTDVTYQVGGNFRNR